MVLDARVIAGRPSSLARGRVRQAVLRLARVAATDSDPLAIMTVLLKEARRLTGANGGWVGRWSEEHQRLVRMVGSRSTSGLHSLGLGEGAAGRAALERSAVIINDVPSLTFMVSRSIHNDTRAAVAAPLLHEGRLLGAVVCLSSEAEKQFTERDADELVMLGSIAASTLVELERAHTAEQLRLLTERFEQFIEATSDAIAVAGPDLRLLCWNRGAERLYGWSRVEVLGGALPNVPAECAAETARLWQSVLETGQSVANVEQVRLTRAARRLPMLVTLSPMRHASGATVGVMEIAKDLTTLKAIEEQQRELSRIEEREAIAMDLHDNTLQALHGAVLLLSAMERTEADLDYLRSRTTQVREQLAAAIQQLRGRVLELRDGESSRPGLVASLERLANQVRSNVRTLVDVQIDPDVESLILPTHIDHLLAVASEAMFNAVRHGRASAVQLRLSRTEQGVALSISDDGSGFDTSRPNRPDAQGLANMSARARQVGGHLVVTSRPSEGTVVRLDVPGVARTDARP